MTRGKVIEKTKHIWLNCSRGKGPRITPMNNNCNIVPSPYKKAESKVSLLNVLEMNNGNDIQLANSYRVLSSVI